MSDHHLMKYKYAYKTLTSHSRYPLKKFADLSSSYTCSITKLDYSVGYVKQLSVTKNLLDIVFSAFDRFQP